VSGISEVSAAVCMEPDNSKLQLGVVPGYNVVISWKKKLSFDNVHI
jgi:hypothetical protein